MRYLGPYGTLAIRHMARWQPSTLAAIPETEREAFFVRLDEEVTDAIEDLEASLRPPTSLQETDFETYVGRMAMARRDAEEEILRAMVFLPPEPGLESEADEPETDETGAYIDRGWNPPSLMLSDEEWQEKRAEGDWVPIPGRPTPGHPSPDT